MHQSAELLWQQLLPRLPKKSHQKTAPGQEAVIPEDVSIPADAQKVSRKEPKFCEHPRLDKAELLSLVRNTVGQAKEDAVCQVLQEGVECLPQDVKASPNRVNSVAALL